MLYILQIDKRALLHFKKGPILKNNIDLDAHRPINQKEASQIEEFEWESNRFVSMQDAPVGSSRLFKRLQRKEEGTYRQNM